MIEIFFNLTKKNNNIQYIFVAEFKFCFNFDKKISNILCMYNGCLKMNFKFHPLHDPIFSQFQSPQ